MPDRPASHHRGRDGAAIFPATIPRRSLKEQGKGTEASTVTAKTPSTGGGTIADRLRFAILSAEERIVLACCRPVTDPGRIAAIRAAAAAGFDPDRLIMVTRAHRVEAFVEHGLAKAGITLPPAPMALLVERTQQGRRRMLLYAGEEVRLAEQFRQAGIDCVFLKGASLAMLAHGALALKTSRDIDVMVAPERIDAACDLLRGAGYRFASLEGVSDEQMIRRYMLANKETVWINRQSRVMVELHIGLTTNPAVIPGIGLASQRQDVPISADRTVPTLAGDELFAYLSVHGTGHGWERMKWLADMAALLGDDPDEIERLYHRAVDLRAGRCPAVALLLCAGLLGTPVPQRLIDAMMRDPLTRRLVRWSMRVMAAARADHAHHNRSLSALLDSHLAKYMYVPGLRYRATTFWRDISRPSSATQLGVPGAVLPLFNLVWIPLRMATRPWRMRAGK